MKLTMFVMGALLSIGSPVVAADLQIKDWSFQWTLTTKGGVNLSIVRGPNSTPTALSRLHESFSFNADDAKAIGQELANVDAQFQKMQIAGTKAGVSHAAGNYQVSYFYQPDKPFTLWVSKINKNPKIRFAPKLVLTIQDAHESAPYMVKAAELIGRVENVRFKGLEGDSTPPSKP